VARTPRRPRTSPEPTDTAGGISAGFSPSAWTNGSQRTARHRTVVRFLAALRGRRLPGRLRAGSRVPVSMWVPSDLGGCTDRVVTRIERVVTRRRPSPTKLNSWSPDWRDRPQAGGRPLTQSRTGLIVSRPSTIDSIGSRQVPAAHSYRSCLPWLRYRVMNTHATNKHQKARSQRTATSHQLGHARRNAVGRRRVGTRVAGGYQTAVYRPSRG
jgi:hypothetical protein